MDPWALSSGMPPTGTCRGQKRNRRWTVLKPHHSGFPPGSIRKPGSPSMIFIPQAHKGNPPLRLKTQGEIPRRTLQDTLKRRVQAGEIGKSGALKTYVLPVHD
jgi:hypothetical protein